MMSTISIRTNEKEKQLIQRFAKFNGISTSEYVRNAVIEKIEDEYDIKIAEKRYSDILKNKEASVSINDIAEILGF